MSVIRSRPLQRCALLSLLLLGSIAHAADQLPTPTGGGTTVSGGQGYFDRTIPVCTSGGFQITYQMYSIKDQLDVYYHNQLIASTGGLVSGSKTLPCVFTPVDGVTTARVVITAPNSGTAWTYSLSSKAYRRLTDEPSEPGPEEDCPLPEGCLSSGQSLVDNIQLSHHHTAVDYALGQDAGCGPCGSAAASLSAGGLPSLRLERSHRYRDIDQDGSFGPGVFHNYDQRLRISIDPAVVELWNPNKRFALDFVPDPGQAGSFVNLSHRSSRDLRFFALDGNQLPDARGAATAELRHWDGAVCRFEIFASFPGDELNYSGRLVGEYDINGNAIQLAYVHPRDADDAALDHDRQNLWRLATITDAYGQQASFSYGFSQHQPVVTAITWPNGAQTSYHYDRNALVGLDGITWPDGASSSFATRLDTTTVTQRVTISDPGAETIHRRKDLFLTLSTWGASATTLGVNQPSNRVVAVQNGLGETSYYAWFERLPKPDANGADCHLYVYEGGGSGLRGSLMRYDTLDGLPVQTLRATDWDINGLSDSYQWELVDSAAVDASQRLTALADAQGVRTEYERDPITGAILERRRIDSDGQLYASEQRSVNDRLQPLREVDELGRVRESVYDERGNLLERRLAVGTADESVESWTYTADGLTASHTDANGNLTDYVYAGGRLVQIIHPADEPVGPRAVDSFEYDSAGRLVAEIDPEGRRTAYAYDSRNRLVTTTWHDSSTEQRIYGSSGSAANLLLERSDRNGNRRVFSYDAVGRQVRDDLYAYGSAALARRSETSYLHGTQLVRERQVDGKRTVYGFDHRNRVIATTRYPQATRGLTQRSVYDPLSRLVETIDPYGRRSLIGYDALGRSVRRVSELVVGGVPSGVPVADLPRIDGANPPYVIQDTRYDVAGQMVAQIDGRGVETTLVYDQRGRTVANYLSADAGGPITDPRLQRRCEYAYDAVGNRVAVRSPRYFDPLDSEGYGLAEERFGYTGRNLLADQTRPALADGTPAVTSRSRYTLAGRVAQRLDFDGDAWLQLWHACCGRLQAERDPAGHGRVINTDFVGNVTHQVTVAELPDQVSGYDWHNPPDELTLREETRRYDARYRPTHHSVWLEPQGSIDDDGWDGSTFHPLPIAGEDGVPASAGLTTRYEYDDELLSINLTFPPYAVDLGGLPVSAERAYSAVAVKNPAGEVTVTINDGLDRPVKRYDAEGHASFWFHDELSDGAGDDASIPAGLLVTRSVDAVGFEQRQYADGAGLVRHQRDAAGELAMADYDAAGNRLQVRDANGVGQDCVYDVAGREIACTDTAGDRTSTVYDAADQVIERVDGLGARTSIRYDARGRQIAVTDRIGAETTYAWDADGNLLTITDAEGGSTTYVYDGRNLLISEAFPGHDPASQAGDAGYDQRRYAYDAAGRLLERIDQQGDQTLMAYDLAGRLLTRRYPDALDDRFVYDAASRLVAATSARYANTVERSYFADGRIDEERLVYGGVTYRVDHAYDPANRLTRVTYPNGNDHWDVTYTERHQLASLRWNDAVTPTVAFAYDPGRRETSRSFANGVLTTRSYRDDNLVERIAAPGVIDLSYSFDADKRKLTETDAVRPDLSQTFGYDAEARLTSWSRSGPGQPPALDQSWELSLVGDWDRTMIDGVSQSRSHNAVHEIAAIDGVALGHDPRGNLSRDLQGQAYGWDYENRLVSASDLVQDAGDSASYAYDALGRRIAKAVTTAGVAETTVFVCSGPRVVCEYVDGVLVRSYGHATYVDDVVAVVDHSQAGSPLYFYHSNHLYSISALTDTSGAVVGRYGYDAYGEREIVGVPSGVDQPYGFTGRRLDDETGLWYFRARYYDDELGRFVGRDSLSYIDGYSLYAGYFVPNHADPTGNGAGAVAAIIGILIDFGIIAFNWDTAAVSWAYIWGGNQGVIDHYGGDKDFMDLTGKKLLEKGSLAKDMWDKARALNSNPVNKGSEVDLHDRLKDAMGSSPIYTTKRDFIIRRLKEGTDHVGFINIDWQDAGEDDLGHALGGAQLHYKYDKGPPCTVAFTVKDTYDFSKKGHMWDHLQDKGRLVTYDVEVEVETQTVSGVK